MRAKAGRITFRIANRGKVGHTFHVFLGERDALAVKTIPPGEDAPPRRGDASSAGSYKMVCVLGNHEDLGMYGTLIVR